MVRDEVPAPEGRWNLSKDKGNHSSGIQELLAVLLAAETFNEYIVGHTWVTWCDNHGVVCSVLAGANGAMDANLLIAQLWLWVALNDVDFERSTRCTPRAR